MARAARRRQAQDALAFERDREAMLVEQLEEVVAETDGEGVDAVAFAVMDAGDAALVRDALGTTPQPVDGDEELETISFEDEEDPLELQREELERLAEVLDACRRKQRALEHYLRVLGDVTDDGGA
jgi:hypothetical protein